MSRNRVAVILDGIRHALRPGDVRPDAQLLSEFTSSHDEEAFSQLVRRHGSLVFTVCQRVLGDAHQAEDAFQATFLVLARRAATVRRQASIRSWLHGVAYRVALKERTRATRRRTHEGKAARPEEAAAADPTWSEVRGLIDEELQSLAEKLRAPLLLCFLEGKTQDEAARELGWSMGTFRRRLDRGRALLRQRLKRRGVPLSAALAGMSMVPVASAAVPVALAKATVHGALAFVQGSGRDVVPGSIITSAEEVVRAMSISRMKHLTAVLVVAVGVLGSAAITLRMAAEAAVLDEAPCAAPAVQAAADPGQLDALWAELIGSDQAKAFLAAAALVESPKEAAPYLKARLEGSAPAKPKPVERERILQLIDDLDSPRFSEREKAEEQLGLIVDQAVPYLKKALEDEPPARLRRRLEALLKRTAAAPPSMAEEQPVAAARIVAVAELIDTPPLRDLMKELASGKRRGLSTEAKAALDRLAKPAARTGQQDWSDVLSSDVGAAVRAFVRLGRAPAKDGGVAAEEILSTLRMMDVATRLLTVGGLTVPGEFASSWPPNGANDLKDLLERYKRDTRENPLRAAVEDGVAALLKSEQRFRIEEVFLQPVDLQARAAKYREIEHIQKQLAGEELFALMKAREELEELKELRDKETKLWQAHYDYVLARLYAREAFIYEYTTKLGEIRKDMLPEIDPRRHKGWRLAWHSDPDKLTDKDGYAVLKKSRLILARLAKDHQGSPWELVAQRDRASPMARKWVPLEK